MIEVKGLVKTFDGYRALDGVNLTVEKGAVYGLVGPNGAGKTTLIRHLAGIYKQDEGDICVNGHPVYENIDVKSRIACISDDIYFFLQASTRDMMKFYKGIYPDFDMARYEKLSNVFTSVDEKQSIRRLSKGMQKQSAFWLAVCCNPEVILLDEPVDGLDPIMRRQVWSIIMADVAERGTTVLVSSHNLRELEDVCDHVGIMNRGKVLLQRSMTELQGNVTKVQIAFEDGLPALPPELEVMHQSQTGRVYTLIVRSPQEEIKSRLSALSPLLLDTVPLSLEEIFVYELGGVDYAVKDIILK